jgi:molybdopterin/thiamine biosynthesis adenylyltransferase
MTHTTTDERFARHRHLPGWDQDRLAAATVLIVGVGALGNAVAQSLALAGVGHLLLCDPDTIERSNLSRMPLFRERDLGRLKVVAAADALAELAPTVAVTCRPQRLESGVGLAELRDVTLTLGCLDSRAARLQLAGRCGLVRAPWLDGGTGAWSGEIRVYLDPEGPCYGCGQEPAARAVADVPQHCGVPVAGPPAGASAPLSAVIGAQMALLAVRFLMGLVVPPGLRVLDGVTGTLTRVHQVRDPDCPYHRPITATRRLAIGPAQRVEELLTAVGADQTPLAWQPVQLRVVCPRCGFAEERPGPVAQTACPRCTAPLRARTTLELTQVPPDCTLAELGIPGREILACRGENGLSFVELA